MPDADRTTSEFLDLRSKIIAAMQERRWSQSDLARAAGIGAHTVSRIVRGATSISPEAERKISEVFGWSIAMSSGGRIHCRAEDFPKELSVKRWPNGYAEVNFSGVVPPGVSILFEVLANRERPFETEKLAQILHLMSP